MLPREFVARRPRHRDTIWRGRYAARGNGLRSRRGSGALMPRCAIRFLSVAAAASPVLSFARYYIARAVSARRSAQR